MFAAFDVAAFDVAAFDVAAFAESTSLRLLRSMTQRSRSSTSFRFHVVQLDVV